MTDDIPAGPPAGTSTIDALSDQFVADLAAASPLLATMAGIPGFDDRIDDLSPAGLDARHDLAEQAMTALRGAASTGPSDDVAKAVLLERLAVSADTYHSGWLHAALNVIESPLQEVRMVFDLMPTDTPEQVAVMAARMRAVPEALAGYRESLRLAAGRGQVAAVRQVVKCAQQCRTYAGTAEHDGFFRRMAQSLPGPAASPEELRSAARSADAAYADLAAFLEDELSPAAPENDAVGLERYVLASRDFLGATVDLGGAYDWGWAEFLAIEREMTEVAAVVNREQVNRKQGNGKHGGGNGARAAAAALDADPAYQVHGQDGLKRWMQDLSDRAVVELGRSHFDIPEPIRTLECRIAPPGGGVGAYYTGPSDDFSRPGRMWWSVETDREQFSTWRETSVVYHEGVPGHHLQIATSVFARERLNDFQRLLAVTSGHAEGWALYAERLVRELGYLEDPGDLLGMLDSQLFRAARVIVDIGMHLGEKIPPGTGFHEGERWTPDLGLEFLTTRTLTDEAHCRDEIDRYLGWPGQAPSYKLGERVWLAGREAARRRQGPDFDLKKFHTAALNLGGMGLDPLAKQLAAL